MVGRPTLWKNKKINFFRHNQKIKRIKEIYSTNQTLVNSLLYNLKKLPRLLLRRSPLFQKSMSEIVQFNKLAPEEQCGRQLKLLENILVSAAHTSYYGTFLNDTKLYNNPVGLLKTLPYLEKEMLRKSPEKFLVKPSITIPAHTSGTTGTPLKLRRDLRSIAREASNFFSWFQTAGRSSEDLLIELRGDMIIPASVFSPPFGIRDRIFNRFILSSYHLSDKNMGWYIEQIKLSGAKFIYGYPSSAFLIADFIKRTGRSSLDLKAVFLASETVSQHQKDIIEEFIGSVFAQYGTAERCSWMTSCSAGNYHEDLSYGFTEYAPIEDGMYEIISTGFINHSMPLLRYRTGDIALEPFGRHQRCECGRPGPGCKDIIGRQDDLFITPDGKKIGRLDHVFKNINNIIAAQIIQHSPQKTEIKIIKAEKFSIKDETKIRDNFISRTGNKVSIKFNYVKNISRTSNGKFRSVIVDSKNCS